MTISIAACAICRSIAMPTPIHRPLADTPSSPRSALTRGSLDSRRRLIADAMRKRSRQASARCSSSIALPALTGLFLPLSPPRRRWLPAVPLASPSIGRHASCAPSSRGRRSPAVTPLARRRFRRRFCPIEALGARCCFKDGPMLFGAASSSCRATELRRRRLAGGRAEAAALALLLASAVGTRHRLRPSSRTAPAELRAIRDYRRFRFRLSARLGYTARRSVMPHY